MRAVELATLLERIDAGVARGNERHDELDKRLRTVETRSDTTAQVARIERVVDQLLSTITDRFKDMEKDIDTRFNAVDLRLRVVDRWRWATSAATLGAGAALGFVIRNSFLILPQ
jgi:hypothetical protein